MNYIISNKTLKKTFFLLTVSINLLLIGCRPLNSLVYLSSCEEWDYHGASVELSVKDKNGNSILNCTLIEMEIVGNRYGTYDNLLSYPLIIPSVLEGEVHFEIKNPDYKSVTIVENVKKIVDSNAKYESFEDDCVYKAHIVNVILEPLS